MAKPTANFSFLPDGLSVQFTDGSLGIPTSWAWDFGDSGTSTIQNPLHVYSQGGRYTVKLTATNTDGVGVITDDLVFDLAPVVSATIKEMVTYNLPVGIPFDSIGFIQQKQTWQVYLQPASGVADPDVFNETKWPTLYNVLISRLLVKDLIVRAANAASMGQFVSSAEDADMGTVNTSGNKGQVKALEVGPSKAQWYDGSAYWANLFKTNTDGSPSGIMANIQTEICYFAGALTIRLEGCKNKDTLGRAPMVINCRGTRKSLPFIPIIIRNFSNETIITITHNLGRLPLYGIYDGSGNAIQGQATATTTILIIQFNQPQTGTIVIG